MQCGANIVRLLPRLAHPQMYALLIILFVIAIGANTVIGRVGGLDDIKRT